MIQKPYTSFRYRFLAFAAIALIATAVWSAYTQQYPASSGGDDFIEHTPDRAFDGFVYKTGRLPGWNPYLYSGIDQPSVIQPGTYYPLNIILYGLFPVVVAHNLLIVVHILLAFWFMRAFLRLYNLSETASTLGALMLVLASTTVCYMESIPISNSEAWIAAIFYFFERWLQSRQSIYWAWSGFCIALLLLCGWPQMVVLAGVYLLLYALISLPGSVGKKYVIGGLVLAFLFSAVLGMVQILPTLELKKQSNLDELTYAYFGSCAVPPVLFAELLIPFLFGCGKIAGSIPWLGPINIDVMQIYVGILPLLFATVSIVFLRRSRLVRFGIACLVSSFLLAVANFTPLGHVLYRIPVYNFFRDHYNNLYFTVFSIAILAAVSLSYMESGEVTKELRRRLTIGIPAAFTLLMVVVLASREYLFSSVKHAVTLTGPLRANYDTLAQSALKLSNPAIWSAVVLLLVSFVPFVLKLRYPREWAVNWLIVALLVVEMGTYSSIMYAGPTTATPVPGSEPILARLKALDSAGADRVFSLLSDRPLLRVNMNEYLPYPTIVGYGPFLPFPYADLIQLGTGGRSEVWSELVLNDRILPLLNVRYLLLDDGQMERVKRLISVATTEPSGGPEGFPSEANLLEGRTWQTLGSHATTTPKLTFYGEKDSLSGVQQEGLTLAAKSVYQLSFRYRPENLNATGFGISIGAGDSTRYTFIHRVTLTARTEPYSLLYLTDDKDEVAAAVKFFGDTPVPIEISNVELRRVASLPLAGSGYRVVEHSGGMYLLENQNAMPRAFLVNELKSVGGYADARAALWSMSEPIDLHRTALVQDFPEGGARQLASGEVRDLQYKNDEVNLVTSCKGECYLVLTDRQYAGWNATIDGRSTKVYTTNAVVRGVLIPAGEHHVRFFYQPRFHLLSLWASGTAVMALIVGSFLQWRRTPRTTGTA